MPETSNQQSLERIVDSVARMSLPDSSDSIVEREMRRLTRRSLLTGGLAAAAGLGTYSWARWFAFDHGVDPVLPWPLRKMLEFNAAISQTVLGTRHLAPEFARRLAREPRANGRIGLSSSESSSTWRLQVTSPHALPREFGMDEIRRLPRVEMVTELKCVEGWSQVVLWGGARLVDFLAQYGLGRRDRQKWNGTTQASDLFPYVQLATPDEEYYVGLDMLSAIHPQTLLCYEMNGEPLTGTHGAPLRLVITVKYGIKNIKQIGHLRLLNERPADYWAERGYDWYAGL